MSATRNLAWLFGDRILRMGVGVIIGVAIARYLGPAQFGAYSYALALVGLLATAGSLGLPSIVVRDIVRFECHAIAIVCTAMLLQMLSGATLAVFGIWLGQHLDVSNGRSAAIIGVMSISLLLKPAEIAKCWFEAAVQSKFTVLAENIAFIVASVARCILIARAAALIWFAAAFVLETALGCGLIYIALYRRSRVLHSPRIDCRIARQLLRDSWPLIISGLAIMVYMRVDQLMLGRMVGPSAVGIYSAAVRLSEVWYFVPAAFLSTAGPYLIRARNLDNAEYYRKIQVLFNILLVISLLVAIITTFISGLVVSTVFGTAYREASTILSVHVWTGVFVSLGLACSNWFVMENMALYALYRTGIGAITNVVLNIVLIPPCGPLGAAIATLASQALASFLLNAATKKTRGIFQMQCKSFRLRAIWETAVSLKESVAYVMSDADKSARPSWA